MQHQGDILKISYKLWRPIVRREDGECWIVGEAFPDPSLALARAQYEASHVQYVHDNIPY